MVRYPAVLDICSTPTMQEQEPYAGRGRVPGLPTPRGGAPHGRYSRHRNPRRPRQGKLPVVI